MEKPRLLQHMFQGQVLAEAAENLPQGALWGESVPG